MSPREGSINSAVNCKVLDSTDCSRKKKSLRLNCKQLFFMFTLPLSLLHACHLHKWSDLTAGGGQWGGFGNFYYDNRANQTTCKHQQTNLLFKSLSAPECSQEEKLVCMKATSGEWKWRQLPFFSYRVKLTLACLCAPWVKRSKGSKWHFLLCRWKLKAL